MFLAVDERVDVVSSQLEPVAMSDRVGGASFDAIATEDTARIINVIDRGVTLAGGNALRVQILCSLDIDAIGRAGRRAEKTTHTLLQTLLITVEDMDAAIARLEMDGFVRIVFGDGFSQHVAEGDAEAFGQRRTGLTEFPENRRHVTKV